METNGLAKKLISALPNLEVYNGINFFMAILNDLIGQGKYIFSGDDGSGKYWTSIKHYMKETSTIKLIRENGDFITFKAKGHVEFWD